MFLGGVTLSAIAERGVIALGGGAAAPGPVALEDPLGQPCVVRSAPRRFGVNELRKMGCFLGLEPRKESDPGAGCESSVRESLTPPSP